MSARVRFLHVVRINVSAGFFCHGCDWNIAFVTFPAMSSHPASMQVNFLFPLLFATLNFTCRLWSFAGRWMADLAYAPALPALVLAADVARSALIGIFWSCSCVSV